MTSLRSRTRRIAGLAAASAIVGGGVLLAAGPAFAATAGGPSDSANATVVVAETITLSVTSGNTFTLAPNTPAANAVTFSLVTNDSHGANLLISAPDLANGGLTIPANALSFSTFQTGGSQVGTTNQQLTNTPTSFGSTSAATAGTAFNQTWLASLNGSTAPGNYSSVITFTAAAQ